MTDHVDALVIGAGPAGLAAAQAATTHGARVAVVDAQPMPGGQIWRQDIRYVSSRTARTAMHILKQVLWLGAHTVVAGDAHCLRVESADGARDITFGALIMATGARELLLPFPGWTLPGVTGVGGLQALAKQGWPITGKRVVIAGSGPLLLAAAASLRAHGAHVLGIFEQASRRRMAAFAGGLWRWPTRATQAIRLRAQLAGVPWRCGSYVRTASGDTTLRTVEIEGPRGVTHVACDQLAVGYGLVPNTRLATLLGCRLQPDATHPGVQVDAYGRTSVAHVYAAGETCGIGGLEVARIEGTLAGHAAVGATQDADAWIGRRTRARRFSKHLAHTFTLDPRIHELALPETLICRCEDVPMAALDGFADARAAKLATRCGMGACQGRICSSALAELGRFTSHGVRPPLFPARMENLAMAHSSLHER